MGIESTGYLLAGQASELERLQLQSRVWEPSGRRLLEEIGDGRGAHALDVGCGVLGWLRILSEWVGSDGKVTGTDMDEAMLAAADRFATEEGLENVRLVQDDLFASGSSPTLSTSCTPASRSARSGAATSRCRPTCGSFAPAAPSCSKTLTREPGTSTLPLPLSEKLIALIQEAFLLAGGDWQASRGHLHLLREFGIEGNVAADVVALPRGIPTCACRCSSPPQWRSGS